jgi:hypothetical protein
MPIPLTQEPGGAPAQVRWSLGSDNNLYAFENQTSQLYLVGNGGGGGGGTSVQAMPSFAWNALDGNPPATNYAIFATVNGIPFLSFASGTTITTVFIGVIPKGTLLVPSPGAPTGGIKLRIVWASATATTGNCNWGVAYERLGVATVASDHFGTQVTQATPTNSTVELTTQTAISIPYANMNSSVAGDPFRLQIQRVTGGSDTMAGAAQLFTVTMETP